MKKRCLDESDIFACDFETTVYAGQERTDVWAAACVALHSEEVRIFGNITDFFQFFVNMRKTVRLYFHNLKFDGNFILDALMYKLGYRSAYLRLPSGEINEIPDRDMLPKTYKYSISTMGQWYKIIIRTNKYKTIEIYDSLKLLPFSLKVLGKNFGTKHQKLEMEYKGFRFPDCPRTTEEDKYISNDVLVLKEALEIMFAQGHNSLTIGSECLKTYKAMTDDGLGQWESYFPNIYDIPGIEGLSAGEWIRKSYKGGWCYLRKGCSGVTVYNGTTADVNSLYPSMMHSMSGNYYPVGIPHFWNGDYIPEDALIDNRYYFLHVHTGFELKKGKLPCIQIKNSGMYKSTEWLESSLIDGKYRELPGPDGIITSTVDLYVTMTDWQLIKEHYDLWDTEIIDGCWFRSKLGIFDDYIDKFAKIKKEAKDKCTRTIAKLFLNNLYGKMAMSTDSSFKFAEPMNDSFVFHDIHANDKRPGYIPCGSAITSYARCFTIRAAQANYYGNNRPGFRYADTDSIHCDLPPEKIKGIRVHDKDFCCWKLESCWDSAVFVRQKTYIEHVTHNDLQPVVPYYDIKACGMPARSKELLLSSMLGTAKMADCKNVEELQFLFSGGKRIVRTYDDFTPGLKVPGKLRPVRIPGGVVLQDTFFTMRNS